MKIVILIGLDLAWNYLLGLLHFKWFLNFIRIPDDENYALKLLDGHGVTLLDLLYLRLFATCYFIVHWLFLHFSNKGYDTHHSSFFFYLFYQLLTSAHFLYIKQTSELSLNEVIWIQWYIFVHRFVDNEILSILRRRFEDCVLYESPDHKVKCQPLFDQYNEAAENWFIKFVF